MIPLRDENPSSTIPLVTIFLILANICLFIYLNYVVPGETNQFFLKLGFIPFELSHFKDISPKNLVPVPLTIFTSMFIHGGWIHLLSNMLYLWIFGDNVEDLLGHIKYLVFYVTCGIAAAGGHFLVNTSSKIPTVGASGAIAGVLGAYVFLFPKARIKTLFIIFIFIHIVNIPAILMLGFWIIMQVLSAYFEYGTQTGGQIAWFAHIGGFASGLMLIIVMKKRKKRSYR
ncbi:MAG: rhomboid family intramembrane serine protease [Thermodesulfobacteriota bacterium]|nr:rhomboid family intramembrane serine protease [Thermodesulfobacteriota bacterium]